MSTNELIEKYNTTLETIWLSNASFSIFFMQLGFAFLEAGTVRYKNSQIILLKNLLDVVLGIFSWWFIGFALAFGEDKGGFIGTSFFFGSKLEKNGLYSFFLNQWTFACTSATIISGATAERIHVLPYILYTTLMQIWIFPIVCHWVWHPHGWLNKLGFIDFAGSGVVHLVGGVAGLVGTCFLKERKNRFKLTHRKEFFSHNIPYVFIGTFVLWYGWYSFNCSKGLSFETSCNNGIHFADYCFFNNFPAPNIKIGIIGVNTTLSAVSAALTSFIITKSFQKRNNFYNIPSVCNGILSGLVAITASCNNIEPYAALIVGSIAGLIYQFLSQLLLNLKIDDPLNAFPVHGGCGLFGILIAGFFDNSKGLIKGKIGGKTIGIQLIGSVFIICWTILFSSLFLILFKKFSSLRIDPKLEDEGFDKIFYGHYSINLFIDEVDILREKLHDMIDEFKKNEKYLNELRIYALYESEEKIKSEQNASFIFDSFDKKQKN